MATTKKKDNEVISPSELIGHSLLENHIFFLSGEIDEFNMNIYDLNTSIQQQMYSIFTNQFNDTCNTSSDITNILNLIHDF
jgi:hypothetical protein